MKRRRVRYDSVGNLVSGAEAGRRLSLHPRTIISWVKRGKLVAGRHYITDEYGRRLYIWTRVAADFYRP